MYLLFRCFNTCQCNYQSPGNYFAGTIILQIIERCHIVRYIDTKGMYCNDQESKPIQVRNLTCSVIVKSIIFLSIYLMVSSMQSDGKILKVPSIQID